MTLTNVALYEALKPTIGEEAARMIAEVVPPTRDLATKADLAALELNARFAAMEGRMHAEATRTIKWIVGVFVPVWGATWGGIVALVLMR
jgi:hypothetical protein